MKKREGNMKKKKCIVYIYIRMHVHVVVVRWHFKAIFNVSYCRKIRNIEPPEQTMVNQGRTVIKQRLH